MQLSIVGRTVPTQQVSSVAASALTQASSTVPSETSSSSGPSELFKKLAALATSDPEKFKQVTAELATAVKDAADASSDPREKQLLTDLAETFNTASQTGDVSVLKPPSGPPPGGPPPGDAGGPSGRAASTAGAAGATSASAKQYAPADANQDGTVTIQEQAVYDAAHPSKAEQAYASTMDQAREGRAQALFSTLQQIVAKAG